MDIQARHQCQSSGNLHAKYLSKSEPETMRADMQKVIEQANSLDDPNPKEKLQKQSNVFQKHRDVSAFETVYRICHLPLHESTRTHRMDSVFKPETRIRMTDPKSYKSSNPKFYTNIIEKYMCLPKTPRFENICLFELDRPLWHSPLWKS